MLAVLGRSFWIQPDESDGMNGSEDERSLNGPGGPEKPGAPPASSIPDEEPESGPAPASPDPDAGHGDEPSESEDDSPLSPSGESCPGEDSDGADEPVEEEQEDADGASEPEIEPAEIQAITEALLFASDRPLSPSKTASIIGRGVRSLHVRAAAAELNSAYERNGSSFRIEEIAGGLQMLTLGRFDEWIARLRTEEKSAKLSEAALDILAVIAYKQPILKADVNHIRGVESGPLLRTLIEKNLVRIAGRADQPGRPMLYGTTRKFLEVFGLKSLADLPKTDSLG